MSNRIRWLDVMSTRIRDEELLAVNTDATRRQLEVYRLVGLDERRDAMFSTAAI